MRNWYETEEDRQREAEVAALVADAWRCRVRKINVPKGELAYRLDYELSRPGKPITAYAEIKCRNFHYGDFRTVIVSRSKVMAAEGKLAFFIVRLLDGGVYWVRFDSKHTFALGGRWDRNDPHDVEMVAHYPMISFRRLVVPLGDVAVKNCEPRQP